MADRVFKPETLAIHAGQIPDSSTGARALPIYQTTSFVFDSADHAASLFNLQTFGNVYSRLSNPTVAALEERIAALEGGRAAVASASGMAAEAMALMTILQQGDHVVAADRDAQRGTHRLVLAQRIEGAPDRRAADDEHEIDCHQHGEHEVPGLHQARNVVEALRTAGQVLKVQAQRHHDLHKRQRGNGLENTAQPRQRHRKQETADATGDGCQQQRDQGMNALVLDQDRHSVGTDRRETRRPDGKDACPQHHLLAVGKSDCQQEVVEQRLVGVDQVHHRRDTPTCTPSLPNRPLGLTNNTTNSKP